MEISKNDYFCLYLDFGGARAQIIVLFLGSLYQFLFFVEFSVSILKFEMFKINL